MDNKATSNLQEVSGVWSIDNFDQWIKIVSRAFCKSHIIEPYEREDLIQFVKLRFLEKMSNIQDNYRGDATIKTYVCAVTLNFCREFKRKNCSKSVIALTNSYSDEILNTTETSQYLIKDIHIASEIKRLDRIFLILGTKVPKVLIALKLYFGLTLQRKDVFAYSKDIELSNRIVREAGKLENTQKQSVFYFLTNLFNEVERVERSSEATRKWVDRTISHILSLLNKGNLSTHTKETLSILMEIKFKDRYRDK